ncbi:MAG: glycosyltransferase family 4 protein, partial [Deltaproteobacteria bacterium]|nr:glycosyltransferase family 4 protein [Deltaproteobacteria bacterium]
EAGAAVRVVTPRESSDLPEADTVDGLPVRRITYPSVKGLGAAVLLSRIFSDLVRGADDVIHVHIPGPMLIPAVAAGRVRGVPVVLKFANLSPERGIWVDLPASRLRGWPIEAATRRVDGVVAISSRIARAAEEGGWPTVARIPNGIDPRIFDRSFPPRANARRSLHVEGEPVVLFVGRLSYQKGVDVLLEAWARFRRRRPRAHLVLLGEGPEAAALQRQAEALGIAASVDFRGLRRDAGPHYAAADIFVLPSRYEGFPNVMLEAMSAGLPVVASRVSGTEDAIDNGRNGLLVPPGEPQPLADALFELASGPERARALGHEARKTVESSYHIRAVAEQTMAFYARLGSRR